MSDQQYYGQDRFAHSVQGVNEDQQNRFLEYQMPGFDPRSVSPIQKAAMTQALMEQSSQKGYAPQYDPHRPMLQGSVYDRNGMPVQGTGRGDTMYIPPVPAPIPYGADANYPSISPEALASQQLNGHVSPQMLEVCNQIWETTHNPRAINQLLARINQDFQAMHAPFNFASTYEPSVYPGQIPHMAITFVNLQTSQVNRIPLK